MQDSFVFKFKAYLYTTEPCEAIEYLRPHL